jgi:hypothetical protein
VLESRSVSYLNIIVISVVIIGILSFLGYQQKWKIETYVQAISPVISAISIVFLVVDRILYEKPHFSIIRSKDSPFKISQHYERKETAFIIQNDGLRDANSVSLINLILTKRFETQKITYRRCI